MLKMIAEPLLPYSSLEDLDFEIFSYQIVKLVLKLNGVSIVEEKCKQPARGSDGGIDSLICFNYKDGISVLEYIYVIQSKVRKDSVRISDVSNHNIPTLIHSKNANGYLLICSNEATQKLVELFEDLQNNCKLGYFYKICTVSELDEWIIDLSGNTQTKRELEKLIFRYFSKILNKSKIKEILQ